VGVRRSRWHGWRMQTPICRSNLQTRKVVERAKGILQRELELSEEHAYLALQRQSRQKRKPMKEIAEAIVLSDEVKGNSGLLSFVNLP